MGKLRQPYIPRFFALFLFLFINLLLLQGCNSSSSGSTNPDPLAISTSSLPGGQVGAAYSATLVATGGTPPLTWSTISGALPTGVMLNATTGAISGTPTVSVTSSPLTFQVKDSGSPVQSKTVDLTLTIAPAPGISVNISPRRGGVTINQLLPLTATVPNDVGSAGVTWSVSTGGLLSGKSTTQASFSSSAAGVYTVTATSNADGTKSVSVKIGVTDLAGVTTYHNNLSRNGTNTQEYALTTANVTTSSFGKLFTCPVDGAIYVQPLWVGNLAINGAAHNVIFVATTHNTVYAFDADVSPCVTYWRRALLGPGETFVNNNDVGTGDIQPDIGIIGTPVIDLASKTFYVVAKSEDTGTLCNPSGACHQRLHGLSLIDGSEKFGGPASIDASITISGTGDGSSAGTLAFNPLTENQRPGLALVNGVVYVSWASHGDNDPYHGWVIGFSAGNLALAPVAVWNSTPNLVPGFAHSRGGIWMSGGAPAADSSNNLYFLTGNGSFDADSGGSNYGDSTVKLSTTSGLTAAGFFTPDNQQNLDTTDADHGSGGAAILIDQPSGPVPHLLIGGGKDGVLYMVNRDTLGGFDPAANHVVQPLNVGQGIFATSAFWNNSLYIAGKGGTLKQFTFDPNMGLFGISPAHASANSFGFPGATPSVSSTGDSTNGIVWALDNHSYCTQQAPACLPSVLHAYDAANVGTELWNSSQAAGNRDQAGNAVKFTVPTVANGKVYVGTRGNNAGGASGSTSVPGELDVYGLLP
jgi:hypothetical protein